MLCLRCLRGLSAIPGPAIVSRAVRNPVLKATFTSLRGPSRPTIFPSSARFRASLAVPTTTTSSPAGVEAMLDLLQKISSHPALGATQVRCGPRDTFSPSHFVRKRRHGFLSRIRTRKGRNTLARRRAKKRSTLSH
ncbi:60S ribosomal protein-like protein L34 [Hyaloscypha finlandica]|nr:60S ribosomal protein-like protein L34 [Hyaloscypha finlandica]